MRRAYQDLGWLTQEDNEAIFGFSLGFDFCAEHEFGARYIKEALGIAQKSIPIGVADRTMTQVPAQLELFEYELRSRDKRVKKTMPAAVLHCSDTFSYGERPQSIQEQIRHLDVAFHWDFAADKKWYEPEKHDIASSWSTHGGFAIHVRGERNVQRLKELHQAFMACSISVADAAIVGFQRKALSLVMNQRLSPELMTSVRERDEAFQRLHDAKAASGVEQMLKSKGLDWYALSPAWQYEENSGLIFFLNPAEQKKYAHGWFTEEELRQWAEGRGPVLDSRDIEPLLKKEDPDWGIHLHMGLQDQGISLRVFEKFVWLDEEKTQIGVRLHVHRSSQNKMPEGTYPLEKVLPFVEAGRRLRAEQAEAKAAAAAAGSTSA